MSQVKFTDGKIRIITLCFCKTYTWRNKHSKCCQKLIFKIEY